MKLTKKLIPAIGMLVLSAVMLATSSFAWFSMNSQVTASGMSVTAKADQIYLQIMPGEVAYAAFNDSESPLTSATAKNTTANIAPTNVYKNITDPENPAAYEGGSEYVWVTAMSGSPAEYEKDGDYSEAAQADVSLMNTFSFRLSKKAGAAQADGALKVKSISFDSTAPADAIRNSLCVLFVTRTNGVAQTAVVSQLWTQDAEAGKFTKKAGDTALTSDVVKANQAYVVDVYVFFNGDHEECFANNVNTESSYGLSISFDCLG